INAHKIILQGISLFTHIVVPGIMSDLEDFDHVFGIRGEEEFDRVYQRIQLEEQENRRNIARRRRRRIRILVSG
ncbi:hypothetical protein L9F63_014036, partial [Diploptera punctata]